MSVYVVSPYRGISGGPEALHQLGHVLCESGVDARMAYIFQGRFLLDGKHPEFFDYLVPAAEGMEDIAENTIVVPEIFTIEGVDPKTGEYLLSLKNAKIVVWWLGAYKCLGQPHILHRFKDARHVAQSHHARRVLEHNGVLADMLTDYINPKLLPQETRTQRDNKILYNPKRNIGPYLQNVGNILISKNQGYEFVAIEGFRRDELPDLFQSAKAYIDLGGQPGMDRLPRETAIHGCCVIIGKGGATEADDMPIPERYKFEKEDVDGIVSSVEHCMNDYDSARWDFDGYKGFVAEGQKRFTDEAKNVFGVRSTQ